MDKFRVIASFVTKAIARMASFKAIPIMARLRLIELFLTPSTDKLRLIASFVT